MTAPSVFGSKINWSYKFMTELAVKGELEKDLALSPLIKNECLKSIKITNYLK